MSVVHYGERLDLNQVTGAEQCDDLHGRARWRLRRIDVAVAHLANNLQDCDVGHEDTELDDVSETGAGGGQDQAEVLEDSLSLGLGIRWATSSPSSSMATCPAIATSRPVALTPWL